MQQSRRPSLPGIAFALLSTSLTAQMQLTIEGDGGAVPGRSTFHLTGTPNTPFLLLFSEREQNIEPFPGLKLSIDLMHLPFCLCNPEFLGTLDAAGEANTTVRVPALPGLFGARMSLQCMELGPLGNPSNMVRVTLQEPETFAKTQSSALLPIVTGKGFVQADGKVLLIGGSGPAVQEYDPALEKYRIVGTVPTVNILATQTQLKDGTILVCGGIGTNGQPEATAFLFDPKTGNSTNLPAMPTARAGHASARLKDGRVLIVGGAASLDLTDLTALLAGITNTSLLFEPASQTFKPGPNLLEQKVFHSATTLASGDVLVAGGLSVVPILSVPIVSPIAQTYTAALNLFGFPAFMAKGRMLHGATALGNGKALLAGGLNIDFTKFLQTQNLLDITIASVKDAVTYTGGLFGSFSAAMALTKGRVLPAIAPLGRDGALIAGGFLVDLSISNFGFQAVTETDLLEGSSIRATGPLRSARIGAVAVPLKDGTVLVTGGGDLSGEIFQPR